MSTSSSLSDSLDSFSSSIIPSSHWSKSDQKIKPKNKKLKGYKNWLLLSDITQLTVEVKGVWDLINRSKPPFVVNVTAKAIEGRTKLIAKTLKIIKNGIYSNLYPNINDKRVPKAIWEILERVNVQVR